MNPEVRPIINRQRPAAVPATTEDLIVGARIWNHIEISGPQDAFLDDGTQIILDIDEKARRNIIAEIERQLDVPDYPGILVDADHLSHNRNHKTEALSWLWAVKEIDGELWGELELTEAGAPAVAGKNFKFFSSEYDREDLEEIEPGRFRPLRLSGLAYTNRPQRKGGKPISNRADDSAADDDDDTPPPPSSQDNTHTMKTIAEKLGLNPEATEEEILAKIEELQAAAQEAAEAKADAEAEAILNRESDRLPEGDEARAHWKAQLIANREGTEKLILSLPKRTPQSETQPEPRQPITNREGARHPATTPADGEDAKAKAEKQRADIISNRARQLVDDRRAPNLVAAYAIAEDEQAAKEAEAAAS